VKKEDAMKQKKKSRFSQDRGRRVGGREKYGKFSDDTLPEEDEMKEEMEEEEMAKRNIFVVDSRQSLRQFNSSQSKSRSSSSSPKRFCNHHESEISLPRSPPLVLHNKMLTKHIKFCSLELFSEFSDHFCSS
jgi:hypothetical protein